MALYAGAAAAAIMVSACGDGRSDYDKALDKIREDAAADQQRAMQASMERVSRAEDAWEASRGPATSGLAVCKVGVGIVMGRSPKVMSGSSLGPNAFSVSYRRDDGSRWTYKCDVTRSRLRWATVESGSQGPWRGDEDFRYKVDGALLTITSRSMDDGSDIVARYKLTSLAEVTP